MKNLTRLIIVLFIFSLASCKMGEKAASKTNVPTPSEIKNDDGSILFKEHYTSKSGKNHVFTPEKIMALEDLMNSRDMVLTGDIFDEKLEVINGKASIISDATLAELMKIPALSKWKAMSGMDIQRDLSTNNINKMHLQVQKGQALYKTWWKVNYDGSFSPSSDPGTMEYNGNTYTVKVSFLTNSNLVHSMNDPGAPK